jgi:hypothetical protein
MKRIEYYHDCTNDPDNDMELVVIIEPDYLALDWYEEPLRLDEESVERLIAQLELFLGLKRS